MVAYACDFGTWKEKSGEYLWVQDNSGTPGKFQASQSCIVRLHINKTTPPPEKTQKLPSVMCEAVRWSECVRHMDDVEIQLLYKERNEQSASTLPPLQVNPPSRGTLLIRHRVCRRALEVRYLHYRHSSHLLLENSVALIPSKHSLGELPGY